MKPGVPDELLAMGCRAWEESSQARPGTWSFEGQVRAILAAVLPEHERMVRKQVSQDILDRGIPAALAPDLEQLIREQTLRDAATDCRRAIERGSYGALANQVADDVERTLLAIAERARGEQP